MSSASLRAHTASPKDGGPFRTTLINTFYLYLYLFLKRGPFQWYIDF